MQGEVQSLDRGPGFGCGIRLEEVLYREARKTWGQPPSAVPTFGCVGGLFSAMSRARLGPGQMQSEPSAAVEPTPLQFESGDTKHLFNHFRRVLITVFGVNALTV